MKRCVFVKSNGSAFLVTGYADGPAVDLDGLLKAGATTVASWPTARGVLFILSDKGDAID